MVTKGIRRTMVLLLVVMTPGIPEYLTGSSKLGSLILDPPSFFIGLVFNIALYSAGALLIREFCIRYGKGWASVLMLGLAYGIMEEGISVHTFFIPSGNPVGLLSIYGRYAGVDWIWALGISVFHAIFSIGLPLLLLSIAYPKYSREPLVGKRGIVMLLAVFSLDVFALNLVVNAAKPGATPTPGDYVFFLLLAAALVIVARLLPGKMLSGHGDPGQGSLKFFLMGLPAFPLYAVNAFLPATSTGGARIPPLLEAFLYIAANVLLMLAISRNMPARDNRRHRFALAVGLIIPLLAWAVLVQIIGLTVLSILVAIIAIVFLFKLRKWVRGGYNLPSDGQIGSEVG